MKVLAISGSLRRDSHNTKLLRAAGDLRQAFLVNPYDLDGMKDALLRAINADPADAGRRMRAMRRHLRTHDVAHWAESFLSALAASGTPA